MANDATLIVCIMDRIEARGSQKAVAEELGISPQYLSDILNGRRSVSDRVAEALGMERVTTWRPIQYD